MFDLREKNLVKDKIVRHRNRPVQPPRYVNMSLQGCTRRNRRGEKGKT